MAVTIHAGETFPEKGARGVQIAFTDDDGVAVIPNSNTIKWTLTDRPTDGTTPTVINSRESVVIASAATIIIVLEGDDLAIQVGETDKNIVERLLSVEFQYNSANLGNNIDDKVQYIFSIENFGYYS